MEIKVQIDEAKIIKQVMDGLSTKDIQNKIVADLQNQIRNRVLEDVKDEIDDQVENFKKHVKDKVMEQTKADVLKYVSSRLTPKKLASLIRSSDWKDFMENTVGVVLSNYVENALSEWMSLSIKIEAKGQKPKSVSLAGIDSYSFRKK